MQDMQILGEVEEVFFDSVDFPSSEEPIFVNKKSGYDIWLKEPESVQSRRENFLHEMGFVESDSIRLNRITESSGAVCSSSSEEELMCSGRESCGNANSSADELDRTWLDDVAEVSRVGCNELSPDGEHTCSDAASDVTHGKDSNLKNQKKKKWWKQFSQKIRKGQSTDASKMSKMFTEKQKDAPMEVHLNRKKFKEFSAVYCGQEINAHSGLIWTMKFSPDGNYLASGGEDGVVQIWQVTLDSLSESPKFNFSSHSIRGKHGHKSKKPCYTPVIVPEKVFKINESPLHEFHGHTAGVLDLAWSSSNCILSSSKDQTVRLWKVGSDGCHGVFLHKNYVTCIQFNPVNEDNFISGSIDGKVRIWGIPEKRVLDWTDVHDIVTAVAYQPNGKGCIVGCISSTCRFYELNTSVLSLNTQIHLHSKKRSSGNRITGIQFFENDSQRVMITSGDSKIHILDGVKIVHKYKGLSKSGNHTSATFTSTGKHIISVGEDSHIYLWDYDDISVQASKQTKSIRTSEHFHSKDISVAIPWSGQATTADDSEIFCSSKFDPLTGERQEASTRTRDSRRFSLGNWFNMDASSRGSVTWPEEMLVPYDVPSGENDEHLSTYQDNHLCQQRHHDKNLNYRAWGLVIVTAGWDGKIRTFHNYGLPVRV